MFHVVAAKTSPTQHRYVHPLRQQTHNWPKEVKQTSRLVRYATGIPIWGSFKLTPTFLLNNITSYSFSNMCKSVHLASTFLCFRASSRFPRIAGKIKISKSKHWWTTFYIVKRQKLTHKRSTYLRTYQFSAGTIYHPQNPSVPLQSKKEEPVSEDKPPGFLRIDSFPIVNGV